MSAAATAPVRHVRFDSMEPSELDYEWAAAIARKMCARLPGYFSGEDLEQVARIACWKCALEYDPSRGVYFRRYAHKYVEGAVLMEVRRKRWSESQHGCVNPDMETFSVQKFNEHAFRDGSGADFTRATVPPNQETDIEQQKRDAELYRAISVLPLRERAVIAASAIMDVPMRLVALRLRISLSLAYVLRQRGLDLLRKRLDPARDPIQDAWPVNGLER